MKVLGSSVLAMEAIVILLATSLAASGSDRAGLIWALGLVLIVLLVAATRTLTGPRGALIGWVMQVLVLATAVVVPGMLVVGGIFAVLWFFAVRNGRQVDALRAGSPSEADRADTHGGVEEASSAERGDAAE